MLKFKAQYSLKAVFLHANIFLHNNTPDRKKSDKWSTVIDFLSHVNLRLCHVDIFMYIIMIFIENNCCLKGRRSIQNI